MTTLTKISGTSKPMQSENDRVSERRRMRSVFAAKVSERRRHTQWAVIDLEYLLRDLAWNERKDHAKKTVILKVVFRHDVTSKMWWTLEWTAQNGERKALGAQSLDLLLWRAAQLELESREEEGASS